MAMVDGAFLGVDDAVEVVRLVLEQPIGVSAAHLEKLLTRLGDRAAVALLKLYKHEDWSDSQRLRRAIGIIGVAMRAPHAISAHYDRSPEVSIMLLRHVRVGASDGDVRLVDEAIARLEAF